MCHLIFEVGILDVKKAYQLVSSQFTWCRGGESNPHEVALAGF
jgi:hypothetical protein